MWQADKASTFVRISLLALLPNLVFAASFSSAPKSLPDALVGHGGPVMGIVIDPGTNRALTASFDYSVILWSLEGAKGVVERRLIGHNAAVNDVAFLPGERAISVSDDGATIIWDLKSGTVLKRLQDSANKVRDVDVSADGQTAAIARWDGTARLIDLATLKEVHRLKGHKGNVNSVAFGPPQDGTLYTASYDGTIRAWDVATGAEKGVVLEHGWGVNAILAVGNALVYGGIDGTLGRIALDGSGDELQLAKLDGQVLSLALSEDGTRVAAGFSNGDIEVFDTAHWTRLQTYNNPYGPIWGVAFADAAGTGLYYTGLDDYAAFWRVQPRAPFETPKSTYPRRFQREVDMTAGERQFQRKCSVYHTLEANGKNRAGPTLYGLFGRKAGSVPGYPYSEGLKTSGIVWNEKTIAKLFENGPNVVTPGSKMPLQRMTDGRARDALIAFLKQATEPQRAQK